MRCETYRLLMRITFLIGFLLTITFANGQPFDERKPNWSMVELKISYELRDSLISMIKWNYPEDMIKMYGERIVRKPNSTYHFLYINSDNLIDAIYSGPAINEGNSVSIFINDGNSLNHWEGRVGTLKSITQETPTSVLILTLIRYGCCDERSNEHFQLLIPPSSDELIETNGTYFIYDTEFPSEFTFRKPFKVINETYHLRAQPLILNGEPESDYFEKGNIVATYGTDDTGIALAQSTDETGRTWWFVVMDPKGNYTYHVRELYGDNYWYGWMSNRFVELVK
jgi:hypothetical protein